MKKLRVTVEGKTYEVLVELIEDDPVTTAQAPAAPPRPAVSAPPPAAPARPAAASGDIVSPLAGKIVSIDVKAGQAVAEGAQVAVLEAMKMNTYLYASRAGTIGSVLVNAGDNVEEGAPIVRFAS
jgi:biotin carboxyl carrier protein